MVAKMHAQNIVSMGAAGINWASDTIKAMLCTSAYTPDPITHAFKSSVTNEVTGTGYTAGGATLGGKNTPAVTAANSWGTSRANSTAYAAGAVVRPATGNGFLYQASTGGTSGASIPTYPTTIGSTVTDGSVVWTCVGQGIVTWTATDPTWTTSTITARSIVIYKDTGTAGTSPIIMSDSGDGSDKVSSAGTFTADLDNTLGVAYFFV
jgi:hypothetical protein